MGRLLDYAKPVSSWTADRARDYLRSHSPQEYNLVDVRQPGEYKTGHLTGAKLIPLGELPSRIHELDTERLTLTYCAAGLRSRAGAILLQHSGFREVHNISGGLRAWQGWITEGFPESDHHAFTVSNRPDKHLAIAWFFEEGTRIFYSTAAIFLHPLKASDIFNELASDEEKHKQTIVRLAKDLLGASFPHGFPGHILEGVPEADIMEGGLKVADTLVWARGKAVREILEMAMASETSSLDRYLILSKEIPGETARKVFALLSKEEELHLEKISRHFDQFV